MLGITLAARKGRSVGIDGDVCSWADRMYKQDQPPVAGSGEPMEPLWVAKKIANPKISVTNSERVEAWSVQALDALNIEEIFSVNG